MPHDRPPSRMSASPRDPYVGVHALSEYLFCPRAALLAVESEPDEEPLDRPRRIDYVPLYFSEYSIVQALQFKSLLLGGCTFAAIVFAVSAYGLADMLGSWSFLLAGLVLIALFIAAQAFIAILQLSVQWLGAKVARSCKLPDQLMDQTPVNWWSLRKSGFESVQYRDQLADDQWKVVGHPWRVLRRGSVRVPVFRMKGKKGKVRHTHLARAAAYCHLLEVCEADQSPFAIVLFPKSFYGMAIPNGPGTRKLFHNALVDLRKLLAQRRDPPAPDSRRCENCSCGFPRVHRPGQTETVLNGVALPVVEAVAVDNRIYHSACGDRFNWIPPHARAREKQLRRS